MIKQVKKTLREFEIFRLKMEKPGADRLGGVVYCFDFQTAVLERYFEGAWCGV